MSDEKLRCAKCGSEHLHSGMRGWSLLTGVFGSRAIRITCLACGHQMKPGEAMLNGAQSKPETVKDVLFWVLKWSAFIVAVICAYAYAHK